MTVLPRMGINSWERYFSSDEAEQQTGMPWAYTAMVSERP